jgi:hypothetical protein
MMHVEYAGSGWFGCMLWRGYFKNGRIIGLGFCDIPRFVVLVWRKKVWK